MALETREQWSEHFTRVIWNRLSGISDLDGELSFSDGSVIWRRDGDVRLWINADVLRVEKSTSNPLAPHGASITHWHPEVSEREMDAFIEELCTYGKKGNIMVAYTTPLGGGGLLYAGPAAGYCEKKWLRFLGVKTYLFGVRQEGTR